MLKSNNRNNSPKRRDVNLQSALPIIFAMICLGGMSFMGMLMNLFYSVLHQ